MQKLAAGCQVLKGIWFGFAMTAMTQEGLISDQTSTFLGIAEDVLFFSTRESTKHGESTWEHVVFVNGPLDRKIHRLFHMISIWYDHILSHSTPHFCGGDFPPWAQYPWHLLTCQPCPHGRYSFLDLISFAMQRHPHAAQVQVPWALLVVIQQF